MTNPRVAHASAVLENRAPAPQRDVALVAKVIRGLTVTGQAVTKSAVIRISGFKPRRLGACWGEALRQARSE